MLLYGAFLNKAGRMRLVFILLVYLSSLVKAADEADLHQSCQDPQSGSGHCADDSEIKPYFPIDPVLNEFEQEDPRLIKAIKERYLIPPSTKAYNFTNNAKVSPQSSLVTNIKRHPFLL